MNENRTSASQGVAPACGWDTAADVAREYRAIRSGAGIRILDDRLIVRVTGDDRDSFLHGMCTADIKALTPGAAVAALFLTEHAHVIAEVFAYAEADAILIEIERELWPHVRTHLERFIVADDVELEELDELAVVDFEGPGAVEVVGRIWGEVTASLEPWRYEYKREYKRRIARIPRFGQAAFTLITERSKATATVAEMIAGGEVCALSAQALEIVRVENGRARVGVDTGEKTLALEARLEPAISFNKGCYVGQETIERVTARGGLKQRLYGLRIEGRRLPARGSAVVFEGREVDRLSSVVASPAIGVIGLAILHHSAWSEGARVTVRDAAGEAGAVVSDLPFARPGV